MTLPLWLRRVVCWLLHNNRYTGDFYSPSCCHWRSVECVNDTHKCGQCNLTWSAR